jgi:hypothetical protein
MSTYVTVVQWSRAMSESENEDMKNYIATQTGENGKPTTYEGEYARSWTDEAAADAFCAFAKALQTDQTESAPTRARVIKLD